MSRLKPTGLKREYLRECLDVLWDDPPVLRWRARPLAHFPDEIAFRIWNKNFAGQTIRLQADGRLRVTFTIGSGERRSFDAKTIIAEIGVTPPGEQIRGCDGARRTIGLPRRVRSPEAARSLPSCKPQ